MAVRTPHWLLKMFRFSAAHISYNQHKLYLLPVVFFWFYCIHQGRYAFAFICLSVHLFVSRIPQEVDEI